MAPHGEGFKPHGKESFKKANPKSADFYERLGVSENATAAELKAARNRATQEHHPDANDPGKKDEFTANQQNINEAYDTLKNPSKRAAYNIRRPKRSTNPGTGPGARGRYGNTGGTYGARDAYGNTAGAGNTNTGNERAQGSTAREDAEKARKAAEEATRKTEEEARRKTEEDARKQAEEDARVKAEEAKKQAEAEYQEHTGHSEDMWQRTAEQATPRERRQTFEETMRDAEDLWRRTSAQLQEHMKDAPGGSSGGKGPEGGGTNNTDGGAGGNGNGGPEAAQTVDPESPAGYRERIAKLMQETRGTQGFAERLSETDAGSGTHRDRLNLIMDAEGAQAKQAYAAAKEEWKKTHGRGEKFPDRATWHADTYKDEREKEVGRHETTDAEFMRTAKQQEAMLTDEKTYFDALTKHLDERGQRATVMERLKGSSIGKAFGAKADGELPKDIEAMKQKWYASRGVYFDAKNQRSDERIAGKKWELHGKINDTTEEGKLAAKRAARIDGLDANGNKTKLSLQERQQRRFGRRDAIFGAREAELRVRAKAIESRTGVIDKGFNAMKWGGEQWGKLDPKWRIVMTSAAFTGVGLAIAGATIPALVLGGGMLASKLAKEYLRTAPPLPRGLLARDYAIRDFVTGLSHLSTLMGITGVIGAKVVQGAHRLRGTERKAKETLATAGARGKVGADQFSDIDRSRERAQGTQDRIQTQATLMGALFGTAGGMGAGWYMHHALGGAGAESGHHTTVQSNGQHAESHHMGGKHHAEAGAAASRVPKEFWDDKHTSASEHPQESSMFGGHPDPVHVNSADQGDPFHPAIRSGYFGTSPHASPPHMPTGQPTHADTSREGLYNHAGYKPIHPADHITASFDPKDLKGMNEAPVLPVTVHAHMGQGYENLVRQLHTQLAKQYPTPDALAHAPKEVQDMFTHDINYTMKHMAEQNKFYDPVHHTSVIIPRGASLSLHPDGHIMYDDGRGNIEHHGVTHDLARSHESQGTHHGAQHNQHHTAPKEESLPGYGYSKDDPTHHYSVKEMQEMDAIREQRQEAYDAWQKQYGHTAAPAAHAPTHADAQPVVQKQSWVDKLFSLKPKAPVQPPHATAPPTPLHPAAAPNINAAPTQPPAPPHVNAAPPAPEHAAAAASSAAEGTTNAFGVPVDQSTMHIYHRPDGSLAAFGGTDPAKLHDFAQLHSAILNKPIVIDRSVDLSFRHEPRIETVMPPGSEVKSLLTDEPTVPPPNPSQFDRIIV